MSLLAIEKPTLSSILLELIQENNLTVSELARRTLVPQPTIQRIASGIHARPHKKTLDALAKFFNISLDQLCGREPRKLIANYQNSIKRIPILTCKQANTWPKHINSKLDYLIIDKNVSDNAFAIIMPDGSMEPLIAKDSILIADPNRTPQYRSFVVVQLKGQETAIIRQLLKDGNNCYIRPLSLEFEQFEMIKLSNDDLILGTVIEVRLNCEDL